ncbi:MAG TPA: hypothetical protein VMR14_10725 [Streptosporangiaceae bacterium]|nr:hypothetical protein [Streptosporangiaceae bacterium]
MTEMEQQLSRLFNAVIGEPPRQVSVHAVRRRAVRRRRLSYATAAAALAVAGSVGVALASTTIAPHRQVGAHAQPARPPSHYFETVALTKRGQPVNVIRSTATGAITGSIRCPAPPSTQVPLVAGTTTPAGQVFFAACATTFSSHTARIRSTTIYQFAVDRSGQVKDFRPVAGGTLPRVGVSSIAAAPGGSEVAVIVQPDSLKLPPRILVINARNGQQALWQATKLSRKVGFEPGKLSFAQGGRELAVFGSPRCLARGCGKSAYDVVTVRPAAKGGTLASGKVILSLPTSAIEPLDLFISPDGTSVIGCFIGPQITSVVKFDLATGQRKVLLRLRDVQATAASLDPSGGFILVGGFTSKSVVVNGWVDHGKLKPLPGTGLAPIYEDW